MAGEKLNAYLESRGVSKAALARHLGISSVALGYKIRGKTRFNERDVRCIKEYLRMTEAEVNDIFLL